MINCVEDFGKPNLIRFTVIDCVVLYEGLLIMFTNDKDNQ